MTSDQLSQDAIRKLYRSTSKSYHFLENLTGRMCQTHFPHSDPLKQQAEKAFAEVTALKALLEGLMKKTG